MYSELQSKIKLYCELGVFPGASYAFIKNNKIEKYYVGAKQLVPVIEQISPGILYDMASLTKVICTNTVILHLWEQGKVALDTPITTYLPEWHDTYVTLRHLLTHTSSINPFILNRNQLDQQELKAALLSLKPGMDIGRKVTYTDTGTILIGFIIEHFYQKSVQKVFEDNVLSPLGMTRSTFHPNNLKDVAPTEYSQKRGLIQGVVHDPKASVLKEHCGSAGLFSTLDDTTLFAQMMLQQGCAVNGTQILQKATVDALFDDWTLGKFGKRSLGWDLLQANDGHWMLYHTGYTGTWLIIDVVMQEAFVFLSNRVHPRDNRDEYLKRRDELIGLYNKLKTQE